MKRVLFFLVLLNLMNVSIIAQDKMGQIQASTDKDVSVSALKQKIDVGFGLGCDYSGLGIKLSYLPIPDFSVFASGGFAMFDFGWNFGACYHIIPKTSNDFIRPHIKAMYGYNEIIVLFDAKEYNQLYYGFTPGVGFELRFGESRNRRFDVDFNFPFRSEKFKDDFEAIDENPAVDIKKPFPIAFAVGYHWKFK